MPKKRPLVLSIGGFDPSGGAGVLADIKTFEQCKALGMSVLTAITVQTEDHFDSNQWLSIDEVIKTLSVLGSRYRFEAVKIGVVPDVSFLNLLLSHIHQIWPQTTVVWDPVLKASAGFQFFSESHTRVDWSKIHVITPNVPEWEYLGQGSPHPFASNPKLNVIETGGHAQRLGVDTWLQADKSRHYLPRRLSEWGKHGSGCVFSAALCAFLARGFGMHHSILKSKRYMESFLSSNPTLLGFHKL
ncbi:MAG TPA: bifunctional hydroxymethylpyrimidine kinase/phosphomethylpyrimidine kinase [Luteibaculaceae bacterium]|nr:bifunctional hydroxymethylpyrimidine kinase/phosphomethylpyrimidine kinase [Luteibaculaceae bacterium]